ncbi:MAG: hypothetical protein IJB67_04585 [Firmicutes bacterium]|nr:hypothetical protein [Bacillota bacterium]
MAEAKKYIFEKLTPVTDSDISVYESAINFVFENDDVKNIAISGAYGAGKSSVLASYKANHPNTKFLHISLAHFQDNQNNANSDEPIKESVLEGKILNQLIHQIPSEKIPQTNFRVKKSTGNGAIIRYTIATAVFLLFLLHILFFDNWSQFVSTLPNGRIQHILSLTTANIALLYSGIGCFAIACLFFFRILLTQKNKSIFKKLSFQGNEIEIFEESDDSYFDKYLNEVLYLFENVQENVVVFEDMDRFDANRIFERLREINTLVNLHRKKENKPILRFFYLLRDDIFISKDRTKFFDCIIPVVPVVDSSNSYNQFISHLEKNNLLSEFNEGFLQGISLYVDDMRLLKNICNEFLVYYNRLNTTELDYNKMFALVTYKNLFPRDFSDLQLNKGFVYALFDNKRNFIDNTRAELKSKIEAARKRIADANTELATSKSELDLIFKPKGYSYTSRLSDSDQADYDRRLQAINDRKDGAIQALEGQIAEYEEALQQIECASLASVITRENIDKVFSLTVTNEIGAKNDFSEIKGSEYFALVKYLIRNGYIDETYADYMTYFYENSLSRVDKTFLRSITDKKAKPYNYELKSPEMVFSRLQPNDFDQEETQNFMLCDYLLSKKSSSEHLARFVSQLRNSKKYSFISQYFNCTAHMPLFIQIFNKQWPSLFVDMQGEDGFSSEQLRLFSVHTLHFVDSTTLDKVNENAAFTEYINEANDYLAIKSPHVKKLISAFKQLNVCFPEIDYDCSEKSLLLSVYENDLYELNYRNIAMFLKNVWQIDSAEDIIHKSYTIISSNKSSPLYKRISNNMPEYVDILLQECNGRILDDECVAVALLNCTDISKSQKEDYIKLLITPLYTLSSVTDHSIWASLLGTSILIRSEQNVLDYFCIADGFDSALISFINSANHLLDFSSADISLTEEQSSSLFSKTIVCNEILDSQYASILNSLHRYYETFNIPNIQESKTNILIRDSIIRMNPDTLKFMRTEYPAVTSFFIKKNVEEYESIMNSDLFVQAELLEILSWDISDAIKLKLLEFSDDEISIIGKNYSTQVCVYILIHNLAQEDMSILYKSYSDQHAEIQKIILENAITNIEEIILEPNAVATSLKEKILMDSDLAFEKRVGLFVAMLPYLGQAEACKYLSALNLHEYVRIFDSHSKPKFEMSQQNKNILDAFKQKGWIFEYVEDETRPDYYKIRRREPRKNEKE